mmetsp:Transcript_5960/g.15852  ORF Transcript_5960/g.15852 Transcript_5960/m.15852 type:complete len:272 (+) Transcript_5960:87-902(+)
MSARRCPWRRAAVGASCVFCKPFGGWGLERAHAEETICELVTAAGACVPGADEPSLVVSLLQAGDKFKARQTVPTGFFEDAPAQATQAAKDIATAQAQAPFDVGNNAVPLNQYEAWAKPASLAQQPQSLVQQLAPAAQVQGAYTAASVYGPAASYGKPATALTPQRDIQQQLERQAKLAQEDERRERELQQQQQQRHHCRFRRSERVPYRRQHVRSSFNHEHRGCLHERGRGRERSSPRCKQCVHGSRVVVLCERIDYGPADERQHNRWDF